ncbi:MAG: glutamate 5-kinase [Eubacteriales bacterium]
MRIVIKIGTSTLAHPSGELNIRRTEELCKIISDIKNSGHEVIIVSSGAIGMGAAKLSLQGRPQDIATKQAAAAVGQCELMYRYDKLFAEYHHNVAQILLTGSDLQHEDRHQNFINTISRLLELKALPIINENDTIATDEIKVGDNDTLSALVSVSVSADMLILLSDIDGLFTADPHKDPDAKLICEINELNDDVLALAGDSSSGLGTGGMRTKLAAADICMKGGCDMIIANGACPGILYDIVNNSSDNCTRFISRK